jgi:hypothetical protein
VSPIKSAIDADTEMLRMFGAIQEIDIPSGLGPRVSRFVEIIAASIASRGLRGFPRFEGILRHLCGRYAPGPFEGPSGALRGWSATNTDMNGSGWLTQPKGAFGTVNQSREVNEVVEIKSHYQRRSSRQAFRLAHNWTG